MPDSIQNSKLSSLTTGCLAARTEGSHKGLCTALLGATMLASLPLATVTPAAAQPAQKPNILFIMGDDIGLYPAEHLPSRIDGRRDAEHRPHRQ